MGYDLMAKEIEVNPLRAAAAFRAAEDGAVEVAGGGEVVYGEGDVEGRESGAMCGHDLLLSNGETCNDTDYNRTK